MRTGLTLCVMLALSTPASAQTGTTYRFKADTLVGTVWVSGDSARRELESGENGLAAGRIEIWKNGGSQIFILDPKTRTYYEENAWRARGKTRLLSTSPLTAGPPFQIEGVEDVRVDVKAAASPETISGYECRRTIVTFSYTMKLRLAMAKASMPGRVQGSQDACLVDTPGLSSLPFHQRLELVSGHAEVDSAFAERVAPLKGVPIARMLTVTRTIENGEPVSATSAFILSDLRQVSIPAGHFDVPKDYRFQEPVLVPPVRKHP